jgi:hypothetical protein
MLTMTGADVVACAEVHVAVTCSDAVCAAWTEDVSIGIETAPFLSVMAAVVTVPSWNVTEARTVAPLRSSPVVVWT